jgi:Bacterial Ig domain
VWPQQEKAMMKFQWMFVISIVGLLLSACGGTTTPTAKLTLTPNPSQVTSGGKTTLTATIDEGAANVASVEFAVKDQDAFATDNNAEGGYTAESAALNANTTFVATAKNAAGTVLGTSETSVTVTAAPPQPNAEAKTVTTLAGVQVVGGGIPTGLAVTTGKLVVQNGTARLKGTAAGGTADVKADGTFTFTPDSAATSGSFDYEVFSGTLVDVAKVTINITALPTGTVIARALDDINNAPAATTILWAGEITCTDDKDTDPLEAHCILLKANQKLLGTGEVAGVTVTNPNAKLLINLADGSPTGAITGIKLANGVTLEGLEISGEAAEFYTAISGRAINLSGTITIKNVKIVGPTLNAPFAIRFEDGDTFGAYYILNVDGLTVTNATHPMGLSAFSSLEFKNSTISMNIEYALSVREFGISFHAYGDATAVVDKLKVSSSTGSADFAPVKFAQSSGNGVYTFTLSNTDVNFAQGVDLATANAFFVNHGNPQTPGGKIVINTANSKGNTTNSTASDKAKFIASGQATLAPWIEGQLEVNGQNVPQ